jgi:hypothetical protein
LLSIDILRERGTETAMDSKTTGVPPEKSGKTVPTNTRTGVQAKLVARETGSPVAAVGLAAAAAAVLLFWDHRTCSFTVHTLTSSVDVVL